MGFSTVEVDPTAITVPVVCFTEFYLLLPGFYLFLLGFTGFYRVLLGFSKIEYDWIARTVTIGVSPNVTEFYRILQLSSWEFFLF